MEESLSEDSIQEMLEELEEEQQSGQEPLSPDVEELLRDLLSDSHYFDREAAAEKLGKLDASNPRIVQALIVARKSGSHTVVRDAAARALRAPVHQAVLQEHPQVIQSAERIVRDMQREKTVVKDMQREKTVVKDMQRAERVVGDMQPLEAASLSPSELILLNGDQFAQISTFGERVELINIEGAVHARKLGEVMLAAAFLANEQAGAVHLEMSQKKVLFGLLRYDELYVVPGEHAISWPAYSFESQLRSLAGRLKSEAGKGRNRVPKIINTWLNDDCFRYPWKEVGDRVFGGLARRGLLEEHRKAASLRRLHGKSGYVLPDSTRALATQQSLEPVRQLLETCRHTRPDVWRWLIWDINSGVGSCRERGM